MGYVRSSRSLKLSKAINLDLLGCGGTPQPSGPVCAIVQSEPRPDFSHLQWEEFARPARYKAAAIKRPLDVVLNGVGAESLSGPRLFAESNVSMAARGKLELLGANGAVERTARVPELREVATKFAQKLGPQVRFAPGWDLNVPVQSVTSLRVYQANQWQPARLARFIKRNCPSGAKVALVGIRHGFTSCEPTIDEALERLFRVLNPVNSPGERLFAREFREFPIELEDSQFLSTGRVIKPQFAIAPWSFFELMAYLRTFPSVRRVESQRARITSSFPSNIQELFMEDFMPALDRIIALWGPLNKTRTIYFPVAIRTGFLP